MTQRLYWDDPYAREFTARVVRRTPKGLVLDRTLFYPTSGGQPHDTGTLNGVRVVDVAEEGEDVVHVLEGALEAAEVKGVIDWDRRLDHMQQHDGQHILSEAFIRVCKAETVSFHLGQAMSTIDVERNVTPADAEAAETLANRVVWENRPIEIGFFTREEASKLPLRKALPEGERIRIVHVRDFDCSACCGTHARSSGETGVVLVTGLERFKGGTKISFVCGHRAVTYARESNAMLKAIGGKISASREEVGKAVDRIAAEGAEARRALMAAEKQLAGYRAKELVAGAAARGRAKFVVERLEDRDIKYLQMLANLVVESPGLVVILGGTGATSSLVLARSQDVEVDLRPIAKDALAAMGGRGGGQAHFVQGGGPGPGLAEAMKLAEERIAGAVG